MLGSRNGISLAHCIEPQYREKVTFLDKSELEVDPNSELNLYTGSNALTYFHSYRRYIHCGQILTGTGAKVEMESWEKPYPPKKLNTTWVQLNQHCNPSIYQYVNNLKISVLSM